MSRKLSLTLFIIALISLGLVILTGINNAKWDKSASYGENYFDSLKNDLNEISLIRLSQSGETFEIKKDNETWMLVNKDSYPADTNKVNTNLLALANAIKIEPKTSKAVLHGRLNLEDPSTPHAKSFLMELFDDNGNVLASAILGKRKPNLMKRGDFGVYLRSPDEDQSWLVTGNLNASDGIKNWINTRLLDLVPDNIQSMVVERGNRTPLKFGRDSEDSNKFIMIDFIEGVETRTSIGLRSVLRRFLKVDFRDMREAETYVVSPDIAIEIITTNKHFIDIEMYNDKDAPGAWVSIKDTDHPDQIKNIGYEFYLDANYKEEFVITLEDVLKIE